MLDGEMVCFQSPACPAGECCLAVKENIPPLPSIHVFAHSTNIHLVSNPRFLFPISSSSYKIPISLSNSLLELDLRDPYPICVSP